MAIQKITSGIIADGAIVATDIADGIVTNAKLAGSITSDKITSVSNTAIAGLIQSAQIGSANASVINAGTLANARLPAGSVLQVIHQEYATYTLTSSTTLVESGLTATITPKSASSFILISIKVNGIETNQTTSYAKWELYKNGSSISYLNDIAAWTNTTPLVYDSSFSVDYKDIHGVTSELTYAAYFAVSSSGPSARFNNYLGANGRTKSSITLMEVAA